jgi:hypothetical protein
VKKPPRPSRLSSSIGRDEIKELWGIKDVKLRTVKFMDNKIGVII